MGATDKNVKLATFEASADLSAHQYKAVKINSSGQLELAGAGEAAIGILYTKPSAAGQAASVAVSGEVYMLVGGTALATGARVASLAGGVAGVSTTTGHHALGICTRGAASGGVAVVCLGFPAII